MMYTKNKKYALLLVAAILAFSCSAKKGAAGAGETISWTDSAGRTVVIPKNIQRIAPSGPLAQIVLYSLCPDKVIGWSSSFSDSQKKYFDEKHWSKPTFGQFYGRNVNLNMEALIAAAPDIIIDIGEPKRNIKDDMDGLQAQLGIPVIFVEAVFETMSGAYLALGEILDEGNRAQLLSAYVEETLTEAAAKKVLAQQGAPARVYFGSGKTGQETNGRGSIHADVIEYIGAENVAELQKRSNAGMDPVSMEQIILWNPDIALFDSKGAYESAAGDPAWQSVSAIQRGAYYLAPLEPYSWMGRPPSVNRLIGIKWLGNLLFPAVFQDDMIAEAKRFYSLFYHYRLSDDEARTLMAESTFK
ncbi:MAG: ABC transporter substrate-binding protein [Spirochaetaceae bacterium]|jgi:iron complex transport system substrate-binding protein|nr:ABC transporter substrate-binding protein [Spirochaetaceae bacterium]